MWIQRGGGRGSGPPWKITIKLYVFSIGNKPLDPTPPPPGNCWTPSGTLKNDRFLKLHDHNKLGTKKTLSELFFVRQTWTPLTKIPGSAHAVTPQSFWFIYTYQWPLKAFGLSILISDLIHISKTQSYFVVWHCIFSTYLKLCIELTWEIVHYVIWHE